MPLKSEKDGMNEWEETTQPDAESDEAVTPDESGAIEAAEAEDTEEEAGEAGESEEQEESAEEMAGDAAFAEDETAGETHLAGELDAAAAREIAKLASAIFEEAESAEAVEEPEEAEPSETAAEGTEPDKSDEPEEAEEAASDDIAEENQLAAALDAIAAMEVAKLAQDVIEAAEEEVEAIEELAEAAEEAEVIEELAEAAEEAEELAEAAEKVEAIEELAEVAEEAEAIEELAETAEEVKAIEELAEDAEEAAAIEELAETVEEVEAIEELAETVEEVEAIEELAETAEEAAAIEELAETVEEVEAIEELAEAAEEAEAIGALEGSAAAAAIVAEILESIGEPQEAFEELGAPEELEETAGDMEEFGVPEAFEEAEDFGEEESDEASDEYDEYEDDEEEEDEESPGKKRSVWRRVLIVLAALLAVVLLLFAAGYGVFTHYYNKLNRQALKDNYDIVSQIDVDDDYDENAQDSSAEEIADLDKYVLENLAEGTEELQFDNENVTNILLIGTDNRGTSSKRSRSDSMIIVSINRETKRVVMTSVMRDIYANIPGSGNTRINAAYAYGGPELLIDTIEKNFKIHLDKYAQVDFYSFMDVVDAVGGVDMNVSAAEIKVMNKKYIPELNRYLGLPQDTDKIKESDAGMMRLNGKQAVAYSRVRYVGNADFGRTERQRKVLTQIFNTAKGMSVGELNSFANVALPCITTNLTQGEVLSLLINSPEYLTYDLVSARMPVDGSYTYMTVRKMSVLGVDFAKNRKYWYETVYGKDNS